MTLSEVVAEARREAAGQHDGPYGELMATYAALGELLMGAVTEEMTQDCRDVVARLIKLGVWMDRWSDQRWSLWMARHTTFGGGE